MDTLYQDVYAFLCHEVARWEISIWGIAHGNPLSTAKSNGWILLDDAVTQPDMRQSPCPCKCHWAYKALICLHWSPLSGARIVTLFVHPTCLCFSLFPLHFFSPPDLRFTHVLIRWVLGALFSGLKWPECEADSSIMSSAVKFYHYFPIHHHRTPTAFMLLFLPIPFFLA